MQYWIHQVGYKFDIMPDVSHTSTPIGYHFDQVSYYYRCVLSPKQKVYCRQADGYTVSRRNIRCVVYSYACAVQTLDKRVISRVQVAIHHGIGAFSPAEVGGVALRIDDPVAPTEPTERNVPLVELAVFRLQSVVVGQRVWWRQLARVSKATARALRETSLDACQRPGGVEAWSDVLVHDEQRTTYRPRPEAVASPHTHKDRVVSPLGRPWSRQPTQERLGDVIHVEVFCLSVKPLPLRPVDCDTARAVFVTHLDDVATALRVSPWRVDEFHPRHLVGRNTRRPERQWCVMVTERLWNRHNCGQSYVPNQRILMTIYVRQATS